MSQLYKLTMESVMDSRTFRLLVGNLTTAVSAVRKQNLAGRSLGLMANHFDSFALEPVMILRRSARMP